MGYYRTLQLLYTKELSFWAMILEKSVAIKAVRFIFIHSIGRASKEKKIHINNSNEVSFISVIYT